MTQTRRVEGLAAPLLLNSVSSTHRLSGAPTEQPVRAQSGSGAKTQRIQIQLNEGHSFFIYTPPIYRWVFLKLWETKLFSFLHRRNRFGALEQSKAVWTKIVLTFSPGLITDSNLPPFIWFCWVFSDVSYSKPLTLTINHKTMPKSPYWTSLTTGIKTIIQTPYFPSFFHF